ncbi:hypothetical protein Godav_023391 [Gossypium davidsonii]|uniref:Uncharacterized protein n=1 Tax=Gossypium davidsonii TaxID=34287 RepID=A0A7J8SRN2_GOSDV|nr:hypothetical protein [Gossypium davidsonii]
MAYKISSVHLILVLLLSFSLLLAPSTTNTLNREGEEWSDT